MVIELGLVILADLIDSLPGHVPAYGIGGVDALVPGPSVQEILGIQLDGGERSVGIGSCEVDDGARGGGEEDGSRRSNVRGRRRTQPERDLYWRHGDGAELERGDSKDFECLGCMLRGELL